MIAVMWNRPEIALLFTETKVIRVLVKLLMVRRGNLSRQVSAWDGVSIGLMRWMIFQ
jgi:hypothetical protein